MSSHVSHKELSSGVWSLIDLPRHVSFDSRTPLPHPKREDAYYFVSHLLCLNTVHFLYFQLVKGARTQGL